MTRSIADSAVPRRLRAALAATLAAASLGLASTSARADEASPPPAATIDYQTKVSAKGMSLTIDSRIEWQPAGDRYHVVNRAQHLLLGALEFDSQGAIVPAGLAPERYLETRRKREKLVRIDRGAKQVHFPGGEVEAAPAGLQDRTSVTMQLAAIGRADPSRLAAGRNVEIPVAGSSKVQNWTFESAGETTLKTPMGELRTVHLKRLPRPGRDGADEQSVDVWLAPDQAWLPVRIRLREANGDEFDQAAAKITR